MNFASCMKVLDLTPPTVPGSSPVHRLNSHPLIAIIFPPSAVTVVLPFARSLDIETITGYGIGTGPPGLGVLQTSGTVLLAIPLLPLWTREFELPFTFTVTDIVRSRRPLHVAISQRSVPRPLNSSRADCTRLQLGFGFCRHWRD